MGLPGFPQLGVSIDFTNGAQFITTAFTLDSATKGILGTAQLADADDRVDVSDITLQVAIRRGRNRILDKFEAGSATVILQDNQGFFNPSNSSSPYFGQLIPLRKIQIFADFNGTRYPLFYGFIQQYLTNFAVGVNDINTVTLQCVDGFRLLNNVAFTTVSGAAAGDLSGTRVTQLLDAAAWPTAARAIDAGTSTLQNDTAVANRNMLDALQLVADKSENGGFFIDSAGNAVFYSRDTMAKKPGGSPVVFTDNGTGIDYQGVEVAHDDTLLLNDVTVQRLGGTAQRVQDTNSQNTYFVHSGIRSDVLIETDSEALDQANMTLATRKDASVRISAVLLNLFDSSSPTRVVAGLDADLFDAIRVTKAMSGGTTITKNLLVQGVQYDITKKSFVAKLLTNEPTISGFVLDSTTTGVLDSSEGLLSY